MATENHDKTDFSDGEMQALLHAAAEREASDVHLVPGYRPTYRVHGRLEPARADVLDGDMVRRMVQSVLPERLIPRLDREKNFDCSVALEHKGQPCRFRANIYLAQGQWCSCLRHVPNEIPSFEWMAFPRGLAERLVGYHNGLVIITGVTGSGKSTTLAAMINLLNEAGGFRIITVEEPIEYVHQPISTSVITQREVGRDVDTFYDEYVHKPISTSVITQREVGRDVDSFYDGLKYGLRQDPDVVLVGEIRDRETAQMALSAAETGHLILTTLHTKDAKGAVTRLVDLFPHQVQDDVRTQLSLSLRSVVSQHLLAPANQGEKRILALEVMHVNQPVRIAIKLGKIESIDSAIQTGKRDGMAVLDDDLNRLALTGRISMETARRFAKDPDAIGRGP